MERQGEHMEAKRAYSEIAKDVQAAQQNDAEAMNRILTDVQDMVYYNCLRMLKSEQAAQDAAQDILITVYRKIGYLADPNTYIGWVKRITANHCKNCLCKVNKEFMLSETEDGEDPFANFEDTDEQRVPDKALDNEETRRMIVDLVDKLPDEQRMCVMLYYYDELKTREIAETLGISENTVKSRLNYARKAIKEGVKAYEQQGIKLYGASPLPFLGYFLGKAAAVMHSPVTAATTVAATSATAATAVAAASATTATAAAAGSAAATTGIGAFFATVAGKIVIGAAAAALLTGVGTGVALSNRETPRSETTYVAGTADPVEVLLSELTVSQEPYHDSLPIADPTAEPESESTPEPFPEQTDELPEETLQRLTGLSEEETAFLLDDLRSILTGNNDLGFYMDSPIVQIWEVHSLSSYCAYRETDAWKDDVPESELACYGVRLQNGSVFYVYLGDGRMKNGWLEHEWVIYRVWSADMGEYLLKQDYLEGPQWTEWSEEQPPEDALEVKTDRGWRTRIIGKAEMSYRGYQTLEAAESETDRYIEQQSEAFRAAYGLEESEVNVETVNNTYALWINNDVGDWTSSDNSWHIGHDWDYYNQFYKDTKFEVIDGQPFPVEWGCFRQDVYWVKRAVFFATWSKWEIEGNIPAQTDELEVQRAEVYSWRVR